MSSSLGLVDNLFEINNLASRIMGQKVALTFSMTASAIQGQFELDDFEIRSSKEESMMTKMAHTILNNIAMAVEDSKYNEDQFKLTRYTNSYKISCKGNKGILLLSSCIKQEVKKTHDKVMKCKEDIKRMATEFGTETVQHVLNKKQMQAL